MANMNKNFISLIAIGGQNPQILNINFLRDNHILPSDNEPYKTLLKREKPCDRFVSVPGFTNLIIGNVEFIVDEQRFQVRANAISKWNDFGIAEITKAYFKTLPYTPLKIVGINFNSTISFADSVQSAKMQSLFLPEGSPILNILSQKQIIGSTILRYPFENDGGMITVTIDPPMDTNSRAINFNYEFKFSGWPSFNKEIGKLSEIGNYCDSIITKLYEALK
jgi:hypothetical protein